MIILINMYIDLSEFKSVGMKCLCLPVNIREQADTLFLAWLLYVCVDVSSYSISSSSFPYLSFLIFLFPASLVVWLSKSSLS